MRPRVITCLAAMALTVVTLACGRRPAGDDPQMSCVELLQMPEYPAIAIAAMLSGRLTAAVALGPNGSVQSVSVVETADSMKSPAIFLPEVEKALHASTYSHACGGRTVGIVFDFRFRTASEPDFRGQRTRYSYPNRFEVIVTPPRIETDSPRF